jgi:hypothetical protein
MFWTLGLLGWAAVRSRANSSENGWSKSTDFDPKILI